MKFRIAIILIVLFQFTYCTFAQEKAKEKIKDGWSFGFFPSFGYDSNTGAKYGGILKLFDYGDGSKYPRYDQAFNLEISRTTKGQGVNQLTYDSRTLFPGYRVMGEISYLTEKTLDFYGFNGYNAYYSSDYTSKSNPLYITSLFYKMERELLKLRTEIIGKLSGENIKWFGGIEYMNNRLDTVDVNNINKGKDEGSRLPYSDGGLYGRYIKWGLIDPEQADGGQATLLKAGVKYDTRDNEANPMKGLWTDIQLIVSPGFISDGYTYTRVAFTHRQYFTLIPKRINFCYRLSYQAKIGGEMPFYMLPLVYNSAPQLTLSGLGGSRTIRGILRNRVVGEDFVYGNAELRCKVARTVLFNQNLYLALSAYADAGMVTGKYKLPDTTDPEGIAWLAKGEEEELHTSYGWGIHGALNENFIVSLNYAWARDSRDGVKGTYLQMSFNF
ncbi:MAG TPA: BamA/TamA family outer membrane protein [Bacteroidales bacterium]|nr:BamA/TamA family outer membrane protein [Bacteroidales bacterium]